MTRKEQKEERKKAYEVIDWESELEIYAYDINKYAIEAAKENAAEAGVEETAEKPKRKSKINIDVDVE